ncbi:MAG: N-acetylneuraminate synthase family protein [Rhodospirillales bacterium]|nr:N-acetylneuraminate synthase family protein [Rhodospirillales bacterium]
MTSFLDRFAVQPVVIAELGAKYADMATIKAMVRAAKDAGADVVKFQTYRAETISTPGSFFTFEDGARVPQFEWFKKHELSDADHVELDACCRELGVAWISTPSHPSDADYLEKFDPIAYKTGSDDLTNTPFLRAIAEKGRPMIVSTGMCTLGEIEKAVETILAAGARDLILLHCVVSYPARPEDANLRAIETLRRAFGLPVGLSDHTTDEFTSVLAAQMGACLIEKHFTLDHALKLPDHQASLDPAAFARLVGRVRLVGPAMGDGVKRILPTEKKWRVACRKSLYAARAIPAGKKIEPADVAVRRPADGLHPHEFDKLMGRAAERDIAEGALLSRDMIGE